MAATTFTSFPGKGNGTGPALTTTDDKVVCEDRKPVVKDVCANDKGNHVEVCKIKPNDHVKCTVTNDGKVCFEPKDDNWCGTACIEITVKDHFGKESVEKCYVTVPEKCNVDAVDDSFCIKECETLCFDVLKNDEGKDLHIIKYEVKGDTDAVHVTLLENGNFKVEALKDADCYDECVDICYTVKDCYGCTDTATAHIKVTDVYNTGAGLVV